MTEQPRRHRFRVGLTDDGKWLVVSDSSPYFVFEGDSAEEVEATANRALDFYFGIAGDLRKAAKKRTQTLSTFSSKKVVERAA